MAVDGPRIIEYIPDMQILPGKAAEERIAGLLHAKYQVHGYSVHLTARKIFSMEPTGQIDFGGSEYIAAGRIEIASQRLRQEEQLSMVGSVERQLLRRVQ